MITSILIANRGEIACRIIRTCCSLGIRTIAVYSDADAQARHVQMADEAVHIGAALASESYLVIENMIAAAQQVEAEAIHPGFGFLAENADFAQACADAGLIFIGPSPDAIAAMGNKRAAKALVEAVGVPTIPGYSGQNQTDEQLIEEAAHIGFPLMVKAAAGGGGKGMRIVAHAGDLESALSSARREAAQAFGSDELILERAIMQPRHVEIQVVGDTHGNIIHLGERECSIQRRHQKVIEETPSPALTPELRQKMGETAVSAAKAVNYTNAGTVEFLLDENGNFYFLEMNTRLQVEHPVTEMVTGIDLVAWQIAIAEGKPLPLSQEQVTMSGHAIEARIYAENPANNFLPVTGDVLLWQEPEGEGIRVESGLLAQDQVSIHYDPMLAKIVAWGENRETAVRRLLHALQTTTLFGLVTNIPFLQDILRQPAFQSGDLSTDFINQHLSNWQPSAGDVDVALIAASLAQFHQHPQLETNSGYWRNNANAPLRYRYAVSREPLTVNRETIEVQLTLSRSQPNNFKATIQNDASFTIHNSQFIIHNSKLVFTLNNHRQTLPLLLTETRAWVQTRTGIVALEILPLLPEPQQSAASAGSLRAPMPGSVLAVLVEVGEQVNEGQPLMKLEAMKMEHTIRTAAAGTIEAIYFQAGDTVEADTLLLQIGAVDEG